VVRRPPEHKERERTKDTKDREIGIYNIARAGGREAFARTPTRTRKLQRESNGKPLVTSHGTSHHVGWHAVMDYVLCDAMCRGAVKRSGLRSGRGGEDALLVGGGQSSQK
jgi:hypothetical protein